MLLHEAADSGHRTCPVLAAIEEAIWHDAPLQLLLLLHMAGGVARHCRVVPEHLLTLFFCNCLWYDSYLHSGRECEVEHNSNGDTLLICYAGADKHGSRQN